MNAEGVIKLNEYLKGRASNFRSLWQDCADYIMPTKGQIVTQTTAGESQTLQIYDNTAEESNQIFAAGLLSQLVPAGEIWARFQADDKDASAEVQKWFDDSTQKAMEAIYGSNFYLAIHEDFLNAGCFGTSAISLEEGKEREPLLNFSSLSVGSIAASENNRSIIDVVIREWKWTARQAKAQWPDGSFGAMLIKSMTAEDGPTQNKEFTFLQYVFPREEFKEGLVAGALRPIGCIFVCVEDKNVIEETGYYENPISVSRVLRANGEVMGRGPGTQILPVVKLVNRMEYDLLLALEKAVNPPWLSPEDAAYRPDNRPGGVTYYDSTSPNNKPEMVRNEARIDQGEQKLEQKREAIRRAFYVDMFQMLNRPEVLKRDMTAYQVGEMLQEKLLLFAPFFARITIEKLTPILERVFGIMLRNGRFNAPPADLPASYKIVYTSKIALAIKAAQDAALMEMLQVMSMMAPFDQSVPMVIKWREAYRQAARNRGVPATLFRTDEEIDAMVQAAQQAAQAQQAAELATQATGAAKNLGPKAQDAMAAQLG